MPPPLRLLAIMLLASLTAFCASAAGLSTFKEIDAPSSAAPIQTAAENLRDFLKAKGTELPVVTSSGAGEAPAVGTILLGTTNDSLFLARSVKAGRLQVTASGQVGDVYEIVWLDGRIVVNGANPRAVLYGVFELEDVVAEQGGVPEGLARHGNPSQRIRLLHPRFEGGFGGYRKSDFEFVARCGGNVAHLTHDWMNEKTLFSYVPSTAFPLAADAAAVERNRARLRQYLEWCRLYGLDAAMWFCEVPCQGGPWVPESKREDFLKHFPAECLSDTGTYQGKVPCLAEPRVEKEYRRMVRQFLTDFPGVSMFVVFTLDSGGELCDPATCPRHRGVSKLTQYNRLLDLMVEEGRKIRPDFRVISVGWSWKFRGDPDYFSEQAALPAGVGLTTPPDGEAWSFDRKTTDFLARCRAVTREKKQTFLGYDIFLWSDDTVFREIKGSRLPAAANYTKLFDFPLGIAAKLRRWQALGTDGFFDQWGTMPEYVPCNAVAMRELVFHPENAALDRVDGWARSLAARRFGANAASQILAAWKEIETAQQIQSDHVYFWHLLRPAWSGPALKCPLTFEALEKADLMHNGSPGAEPSKPDGDHDYSPFHDDVSRAKALAPALREAAGHYTQALAYLRAAEPLVREDAPSALDHWYRPESGAPRRFSPRRLLEEEIIAVRWEEQCQLRMSRFFEGWALVHGAQNGEAGRESMLHRVKQLNDEEVAAGS